jgi:hypothetical protein
MPTKCAQLRLDQYVQCSAAVAQIDPLALEAYPLDGAEELLPTVFTVRDNAKLMRARR